MRLRAGSEVEEDQRRGGFQVTEDSTKREKSTVTDGHVKHKDGKAEAEGAESITGLDNVEATGDVDRSWIKWCNQVLLGISSERLGREEIVTVSLDSSSENFFPQGLWKCGGCWWASKVKDKLLCLFIPFFQRQ